MKIRLLIQFIAIAALVCLGVIARAESAARHPEGVVAYCFDGDTIKLQDRRVVRLAGIDAPEKARNGEPAQYYSGQARATLESLLRGKKVALEFPGTGLKDRYGRLVANIILPDGKSANELMVSAGSAYFYPHQDLNPEFQEKLREAQADAIHERRGMWERLLSLPLAQESFTGNRNSLRFFPEGCLVARKIAPRNRENFGNLMDAFLAGYAPGRIPKEYDSTGKCRFWPLEN